MDEKILQAFNEQIQAEFYSAYMYLAMSISMEAKNLKGMAHWLYKQYEEERGHALRLMKFVQERGESPELLTIEMPPVEYGCPLELFTKVLAHEKYVTERIRALYELALEHKDYAAQNHLQWFIDEQVEEEASAAEIAAKLELIGDNIGGIFIIDGQLAARK